MLHLYKTKRRTRMTLMVRLLNNKMNVSRNAVNNWFVKGSEYLNKVLSILKEKLLAKGAVVNCDETW